MSSLPYSPATPRPIPSHLNQGSSPRQIEPNSIPKPPDRWHPKITVYRLMIVLLGFGLGTAKAWATWRGETILSITLEWISAVVISSILFILSWYDNLDDAPTPVLFLFSYDCLDIIWRILYIPKPAYRSDECSHIVPPITDSYPYRPLITGYRILVSSIMAAFGLSKMICSYMGLNTAATAIEWVTASIVGTSLYLLGLYEGNTCNVLPILFTTDYSGAVEAAFYAGK
ncbi:hypothetical protein BJ912DRAFT_862948 [Pholiota molesta]|nr:hypothetical protein BJ912DRAFT_862948 [Pholiota molesta]